MIFIENKAISAVDTVKSDQNIADHIQFGKIQILIPLFVEIYVLYIE